MRIVGTLGVCWPSFGFVCHLVVLVLLQIRAHRPFDVVGKVRSCEPVIGRRTLVGGLCETLLDTSRVINLEFWQLEE